MRLLPFALALAVTLPPAGASANPSTPSAPSLTETPVHTLSYSTLTTDGGSIVRLPPSYCLAEPQWDKLDLELRRLQEAETRLKAENKSLQATSGVGFWGQALGFATGIAAGYAAVRWGDDALDKLRGIAE